MSSSKNPFFAACRLGGDSLRLIGLLSVDLERRLLPPGGSNLLRRYGTGERERDRTIGLRSGLFLRSFSRSLLLLSNRCTLSLPTGLFVCRVSFVKADFFASTGFLTSAGFFATICLLVVPALPFSDVDLFSFVSSDSSDLISCFTKFGSLTSPPLESPSLTSHASITSKVFSKITTTI